MRTSPFSRAALLAVATYSLIVLPTVGYCDESTDSEPTDLQLSAEVSSYDPSGDWDGDGLSNQPEVLVFGTDPLLADTNGNGIPDYLDAQTQLSDMVGNSTDQDPEFDALGNPIIVIVVIAVAVWGGWNLFEFFDEAAEAMDADVEARRRAQEAAENGDVEGYNQAIQEGLQQAAEALIEGTDVPGTFPGGPAESPSPR